MVTDGSVDNVRVYVPVDINPEDVLRRLREIVSKYGEANEGNEMCFSIDVSQLVSQIEIYDQIWIAREMDKTIENSQGRTHSMRGRELVREFVKELEEIPDGCAECFPFELIDNLNEEYL